MQEVQALCNRVVIINKGKIVADGDISTLQQSLVGQSSVVVEFLENVNESQLTNIPNALSINKLDNNEWLIKADLTQDIRPNIFTFAVKNNLTILEMRKEVSSVEDVFHQLTS